MYWKQDIIYHIFSLKKILTLLLGRSEKNSIFKKILVQKFSSST